MKVFISWSGDLSHSIAVILKNWLPVILHYVEPWVSDDIPKGTRWNAELASELEDTRAGIVCLVPDNINAPWLMFEAGALSKSVATARIHPFLVGIEPRDLTGPLAQFQATRFSKDDLRKLIGSLNSEAREATLSSEKVDGAFEMCWPILEQKLAPLVIVSLKDLVDPSPVSGETEPNLTAEELTILRRVANSRRVYPKSLEADLTLHWQRIQYIMESLEAIGFLCQSHNAIHGPGWSLSEEGRAFLVKKDLL